MSKARVIDPIAQAMRKISAKLPDLTAEEQALVSRCLADCFEYGRVWDSIPTLVQEAHEPAPPKPAARKDPQPQDAPLISRVFWNKSD